MTITVLDIDPAHSPVQVTISLPDGSSLQRNGNLAAGQFGIMSGGVAYFDPAGATIGETAALGWDGSVGRFFLHSGTVDDQPHLMLLREARVSWEPLPEPAIDEASTPARPWKPAEPLSVAEPVGKPARPWRW